MLVRLRRSNEKVKQAVASFGSVTMHRIFTVAVLLISTLALTSFCYGSDFVFIRSGGGVSAEQDEMQVAASFYGLGLRVVTVSSHTDKFSIRTAVEQKETIGVVIDAEALAAVSETAMLRALNRKAGRDIPLFILGVGPEIRPDLLKVWSGSDATRCSPLESSSDSQYVFGRVEGVTWQLADLDIPVSVKNALYFMLDDNGATRRIESVRTGSKSYPIVIESKIGRQLVFLACSESAGSKVDDEQDIVHAFLRIAPAMMFVRYCAGERGWHALHYYANFTIDDPWLREPYGYVDYKALLGEMEKHHFHTTIAFIPWNYDRSEPEVASLFRDHPDKFSIAIHGNNHDHKEFTDYRSKSLAVQVGDIKQALIRMERFRTLTGIAYDKVMIFPHSIAPEQTIGALKTYNYLATVNSSNVPENATGSGRRAEVLRPVTLSFEGFPSISRYSAGAKVPEAYLAINQFLGNPLFFYEHSNLFSTGMGAFNHVADEVNKREPATEWRSLGEIVRHFYVVKLRDDSDYDVLAFASNICLENPFGRNSTFYLQKQEIGGQTIDSVTVDGMAHAYTLQTGLVSLAVAIPLGGVRCVAIQYVNNLQAGPTDASHDSLVVYLLRMGSDFRDIYLAKSRVGLAAIRFYNDRELEPAEVIGFLLLLLVASIYVCFRLWVYAEKALSIKSGSPELPYGVNRRTKSALGRSRRALNRDELSKSKPDSHIN
jgi:hypothetical protein